MELAILLQELMKRGWKAFGEFDKLMSYGQTRGIRDFGFGELGEVKFSLRELVSKESGLWQFICKNGMIKKNSNDDKYNSWQKNMYNSYLKRDRAYAEYRLIGSALCDEDKLEKFLLDNIKVDD